MHVVAVSAPLPHPALEAADWSDRFEVLVTKNPGSAESVGRRMFTQMPFWVRPLLALRNILVMPLGLKDTKAKDSSSEKSGEQMIGFFPIVFNSQQHVVLGFDDRHLDFRVVVDNVALPGGQFRIGVQTVIRRHNFVGRFYLFLILPFHRMIVRASMARLKRFELS